MLRIIHTDIDFPLLRGAHSHESEVTSTYDQIRALMRVKVFIFNSLHLLGIYINNTLTHIVPGWYITIQAAHKDSPPSSTTTHITVVAWVIRKNESSQKVLSEMETAIYRCPAPKLFLNTSEEFKRLFFCIVPNNHIKNPIWLAFNNKNNTIATWKQTVIPVFQTHTGFNRSLHQFALNLLLPPHSFSHCYGHCQPRPPAPAPAACRLTYLSTSTLPLALYAVTNFLSTGFYLPALSLPPVLLSITALYVSTLLKGVSTPSSTWCGRNGNKIEWHRASPTVMLSSEKY